MNCVMKKTAYAFLAIFLFASAFACGHAVARPSPVLERQIVMPNLNKAAIKPSLNVRSSLDLAARPKITPNYKKLAQRRRRLGNRRRSGNRRIGNRRFRRFPNRRFRRRRFRDIFPPVPFGLGPDRYDREERPRVFAPPPRIKRNPYRVNRPGRYRDFIPPSRAISVARSLVDGRLIGLRRSKRSGRDVYVVKFRTSDRVREIVVDAISGRVIN